MKHKEYTQALKNSGLTVQDKVIFQLSETSDIIAAFWGCILCGVIPVILAVPPSYENISNDINKICQVWELLEHPLIITNEFCKSEVKTLEKWLSNQTLNIKLIEELKAYSPQEYYYINQPEDIAFFSLTSGSTGMSKCIPLTHKNLLSRGRGTNELCGYSKDDIILNWLPFDHIGSISEFHIRCVDLGCDMVYVETDYILSRPLNWLDLINQYRITNSWSPNFAYTLINEALKKEPSQNWNLSCVKFVLTAGEAVSDTTVEEFINKLHNQYKFKKTAVRPAFGMAEMGSGITYYQGTEEHPLLFHTIDKFSLNQTLKRVHPEHPNGTTFTDLGLPISGISIRIVNQDNVLLPEDTIGHLQVKGDAVSPGYYKNPEANKKAFLKDGWFDTGDLGFIKDGHLIITGRSKETIIINGVNYYSHEIETVVDTIEVVEASYTAACAVKEDNSQTDKLALFFSTQLVTSEELKNLLKKIRQKVINNFGINPDYLIPLNKKEIPKTSIGKTQRSQLIERFRQGEFKDIIKEIDILLENNQTIPDWFYRKVWQEKKIFHLKQNLPNGHTLIFLDQLGLGEFLAKQLQEKNLPYITILAGKNYTQLNSNSYTINPTESDHYLSLITSLAQQNHPISNIIHLWTYQTYQGEIDCSEQLEKAQEEGIYSLLFIVQALAKNQYFAKQYIDEKIQLLFISSDSQWVDNHEKIAYEKSPVLGLNKTISQEFSWINSRHIDLPVDGITLNSKLILEELLTLSKEKEIAYRQGKRLVKGLEKVEFSQKNAQKIPFEQGGIYLITGGLGGIGIEISQYLLKNYNARLLLLGTTILPDKKDWNEFIKKEDKYSQKIKHLQTLEKLGGEVIYKAVDIGNLTQLEKAVNEAQNKWQSKLNGVIHLAGIYQEKLIIEQTKQNLSELLRPKVLGTWNLHQLMKKERVMFISFSSLASFFGGATLSGYTAANRFLEHLNDYQQATNVYPSYCYSWTSWQETGMSQGKYTVRSQGYYSVTVQQGLNSFLASLYHHHKQLMIGLDGNKPKIKPYISLFERLEKLTAYYSLKPSSNALKLPSKLYLKDRFATSYSCQLFLKKSFPLNSYGRIDKDILLQEITGKNDKEWIIPRNDTETKIAQIWQEILNIQKISIHDNFFELGGHSLLASQVISRLHNTFSVHLSLKNLLDYPTIANLGQIIEVLKMTQNAKILLRKTEKDYEEGEL
ncbi:SDR family NAD(P)-dependent oxidoreductase [Aphanothece sacrum]|uniref:Peptide synthetase n=1 Tax=Aphanothece sacrum FPU1 TaxID=1920663 RepID=A0A401IG49_APHSA|nr:SDR family NAD(P)-dependent oxidoreductase [Aphanothece sacrum]GBF80262.1 peptide synthetase [Aphanothece sacrum FPU1]GBF83667.1 peptide synthetase [Aphanothece sacrum FPU3]